MSSLEIEEEIDNLKYVIDLLDSATNLLKDFSCENTKYNFTAGKIYEIINELENDKEELINKMDIIASYEIKEIELEHIEREIEYKKMQGF